MPTPVGHSLIGLSIGLFRRRGSSVRWRWLLACMVIANLPDLDYIPGILAGDLNAWHHHYTHTLGWILLCGFGLRLAGGAVGGSAFPFSAAVILSLLASHLLADWLTADGRAPYGIMALWPLTERYFISPVTIFPHVRKLNWAEVFQGYNVRVALIETAITLPLIVAARRSLALQGRGQTDTENGAATSSYARAKGNRATAPAAGPPREETHRGRSRS